MRNFFIYFITIMLLALSACTEVGDAGDTPNNAVYMGNPDNSGTISMVVSIQDGGSAILRPRLANITHEPITVTLAVDKQILDDYNSKYGLELELLAPEDFVFVDKSGKETIGEANVTIPQNDFQTSVEVKVKTIDESKYSFDKRLAIPIVIKSASKHNVLSSPKSTIVRLNREMKTSIGFLKSLYYPGDGGGIVYTPKTPVTKQMDEWTFQMSAIFSSLTVSNQTTIYIGNSGGGPFYTRISASQGIQVKNARDGEDTWTQQPLNSGEWLHISYVYKNQSISVYVNGVLQKTFETSPIYLQSNSSFNMGNYTWRNIHLREVRFWNRALSEAEIIDKLFLPQDPQSPDLMLYVPVTKETELKDITEKCDLSISGTVTIEYIDNVIFPSDKLVILEENN